METEILAPKAFGGSVAIVGDLALVGSASAQTVYLYLLNDTPGLWAENGTLRPSVEASFFASSIAVKDDTIVVGAQGFNDSGGVFVYKIVPTEGGSRIDQALVFADVSGGSVGYLLGASVALDGSTVVAGAPGVWNGDHEGSSYVFTV